MAKIMKWTPEQFQIWHEWVDSRLPHVKAICLSHPADRLYRLKTSGHRVTITSYQEDGTVSVEVSGTYNCVFFERSVFYIKPEDLIECDLPRPSEKCGVLLTTPAEVDRFLKMTNLDRRFFWQVVRQHG